MLPHQMHSDSLSLFLFNLNWPNVFGIICCLCIHIRSCTLHSVWSFFSSSMSCVLTQLKKLFIIIISIRRLHGMHTTCIWMYNAHFFKHTHHFFLHLEYWFDCVERSMPLSMRMQTFIHSLNNSSASKKLHWDSGGYSVFQTL